MAAPAAAPPPEGPRADEIVRAVVAGLIELVRALRQEVKTLQDDAEAFVGRVKGAIVRSLRAFQRALVATMLALVFVILFAIVLAIFLVAVLNKYLGDPWGTGVAAALLLVGALVFGMRARSNFKEMEREAAALSARGR